MKKVIVICGPTAVGKTALSVSLAKIFNAEIISGDSVQVYRKLDIGSAKITESEKEGVRHHLIDILDANETFDVATFQHLVRKKIEEIDIPFIVGGTGLYIKAALYNYEFDVPKRNLKTEENYASYTNEALFEALKIKDIEAAKDIHPNNRRRVLRALELSSTKKRSAHIEKDIANYDALILYVTMPRVMLYERINLRVDIMMADGFLEEVRNLKSEGISPNILGYRELNAHLEGKMSLLEATDLIKQKTRHLAKRQETWFRHQMKANLLIVDDKTETLKEMERLIFEFLEAKK